MSVTGEAWRKRKEVIDMKSPLPVLFVIAALLLTTMVAPAQERLASQKRQIREAEAPAPKTVPLPGTTSREEPAVFASLIAERKGEYVSIVWNMASEKGILGYNVYRHSGGSARTVNESIIGGSAMIYGNEPVSGQRYEIYDRNVSDTDYFVIEALTTAGKKILSSPVFPSRPTTRQPKEIQPFVMRFRSCRK